jgi:hypothetical protein
MQHLLRQDRFSGYSRERSALRNTHRLEQAYETATTTPKHSLESIGEAQVVPAISQAAHYYTIMCK